MLLTFTNPFGDKEHQALDSLGMSLGALLRDYADNVGGCLINGRVAEDWRAFVGGQGDRVEIVLKVGGPFLPAIISAIISLALSMIMRALTPQPKKPKQNNRRQESFGIAGFTNTTGPGLPKFVVYGRNRVYGHVIGSGADLSPDGRQMFGRVLYLMGDTGLDGYESITDVTMDETAAAQFPEVVIETRLGLAGQAVIPHFENSDQLFSDNRELAWDRDSHTGTPIVYTTRGVGIQRARIFFQFPAGLYRVNGKGKERGAIVNIRVETKKNSDPFYTTYAEPTYSGQQTSGMFQIFDINFPSAEKWDIRVTKIGEGGFTEGEPFFGDVILFNVQETVFTNRNYPGSALLAVVNIPARQIRSLESLRVSALVDGKRVKVWDGANFTVQFSRKRCWIVRDMMTHPIIGMGDEIAESEINDNQWLTSQGYYDELVTGHDGNELRDVCDFVMNDSQWDWEWIKGVAGEGRGRVIPSGDKWNYVIDKPGNPALLYAEPGNMIEGSLVIELGQQDRPFNQVIAEFRDATNDYKPEVAPPITDPDIGSDPIIQESRRYDTITRESQVQRENMIILKREKLEKRRFQFMSPKGAIVSEPLDIDYLAERAIGDQGSYTGFLPAGSTQTNIILPFPCKLEAGETYALIIRHSKDNTVEYRTVNTSTGTWGEIVVSSGFVSAPLEKDLFALGIENVDHILTRAQDITIDNEGRVRQLRTEYIPAVYTADALPPKAARRFFRLGDQPPPLPLRDAIVREEVALNRDGSQRTMLIFDVTPGLPKHSGTAQAGDLAFIMLDSFEPPVDDYYNTAIVRIVDGTGVGQERKISDYEGTTRRAYPDAPFTTAPNSSSVYEIEWVRFGEFGGFKVEHRDDVTMNFVEIARAGAIHWETDGRGQGPDVEEYRFTPFSIAGVENVNGRLIRSLVLAGDLSAPAPPLSVGLGAYLKTVTATITFQRPMAEDFSSTEVEFWRGSIGGGTLLQTTRYGAAPDTAASGTMQIMGAATFPDEPFGTVIWARARSVDRSNNYSAYVESPSGVTLDLPPDFGPDLVAPGVPTGLILTTGVQPDPVSGLPVVFLQASWDANPETDISVYELQYRQIGTEAFTTRLVFHPQVSSRDLGVVGNVGYEARLQAIDNTLNKSGFTAYASIITAKDNVPPGIPTSLSTIDGFKQILIRFTPPGDVDFATVEVWRSQTNDRAASVRVGESVKGAISYTDANLDNDLTFYYWLRARDASANVSAFTPGDTAGLVGHTLRIDGNDVVIASALITNAAQIGNAIVNNAHISNLSADKITAGTLAAAYSIGAGGFMSMDGTNGNIVIRDQQGRVRIVLGRVGSNPTDYGMQIYGADGSLWMSETEGLKTGGLAANAASQLSQFADWTEMALPNFATDTYIGYVDLVCTGGPVLLMARTAFISTDQTTPWLRIWRGPIGDTMIDNVSGNGGQTHQQLNAWGIDFPPAGLHRFHITVWTDGSNGSVYNRRLQVLETKR